MMATPIAERLWRRVEAVGSCWHWTGARLPSGYGRIGKGGKHGGVELTHRVAWMVSRNESRIPNGMYVMHTCDNPICCRPDHLVLGTPRENTQDMILKQRHSCGERHGPSKLTVADVLAIRESHLVRSKLASRYGVSETTIDKIIWRQRWRHVA